VIPRSETTSALPHIAGARRGLMPGDVIRVSW
jgi:hypothetical protein